MNRQSVKELPLEWRILSLDEAISEFVRNLEEYVGKTQVRIVSGEGNHLFWNDPRVVAAMNRAITERKAEFAVIAGPVISIDAHGRNTLVDLAVEEKIGLYLSPSRMKNHYRVYGTVLGWEEKYHPPLHEDGREGRYVIEEARINELTREFDQSKSGLEGRMAHGYGDVIKVSTYDMEIVNEYLDQKDLSLDEFDFSYVSKLLKDAAHDRVLKIRDSIFA